jgi:quercetin dioxygenase-like cupin family protein
MMLCVGCATTQTAQAPEAQTEAPAEAPAQEAAAPAAVSNNVVFADVPFKAFNPKQPDGLHVYPLSGNPGAGAFTAIVKMPAGFKTPLHTHTFAYDGVALSGGLFHGVSATDIHDVEKGSVWRQPADEAHIDGCKSETPCYMLVSFEGAVDMKPAESPAAEPKGTMTKPADLQWNEVKGGVKMSVLRGNPKQGAFLALFDFPAGMQTNVHTHSASFDGALLSGTHHRGPSADSLVTLTPSSVWHEAANTGHMEKCGAEERCVMFASFAGPLDTHAVVLTPSESK